MTEIETDAVDRAKEALGPFVRWATDYIDLVTHPETDDELITVKMFRDDFRHAAVALNLLENLTKS